MDHLLRLGNSLFIPIRADENGFLGRECPQPDCEKYFKVQLGTGLEGEGLPCHCPYCGYTDSHDHFWTKDQIEYVKSVATQKISDALRKDLKKLEFDYKSKGPISISVSSKVKPGPAIPIHDYREKHLETEVVCVNCTLRYWVYGVFAFCPDCGQHNSLQILDKNLELVAKMLDLAADAETVLAERLIENALEDCVSAFDGFGRELCRVHANRAQNPAAVERISFQNLLGARTSLQGLFGIDIAANLAPEEWHAAVLGFQRRHLVTHKLGVVDREYITKTRDTHAVVGRKIGIGADEVRQLARIISKLAQHLSDGLQRSGTGP